MGHARRKREKHTDTQRHTQTHTDTHRHTRTHTDTHRHTQTHTDTRRHTQTHRDTHKKVAQALTKESIYAFQHAWKLLLRIALPVRVL